MRLLRMPFHPIRDYLRSPSTHELRLKAVVLLFDEANRPMRGRPSLTILGYYSSLNEESAPSATTPLPDPRQSSGRKTAGGWNGTQNRDTGNLPPYLSARPLSETGHSNERVKASLTRSRSSPDGKPRS